MSIASELTKLESNITNAYNAIDAKGGTIPANKNTNNLVTAINSISGGGGGKSEQSKTATPSISSQTILPDEGYTLSSVTVNAVDKSIDSNIQAENIKEGISILGVSGTMPSAESLINKTIKKATVPSSTDTIRAYLFQECTELEEITIEEGVTVINTYAFYYCIKLKEIIMPSTIKILGTHAFDRCTELQTINLSSGLTTLGATAFGYCPMTIIDIPSGVKSIAANTFNNCTKLNKIILRSNTLCALANVNAFIGTPFRTSGAGGVAYVPSALISEYESATNWSSMTNITFKPIEGSEYE